MPLIGVYYLAVNYLQSVGKAAQASVLSVLRQGAVYVPLLLSLHGLFGLFGVFYAAPAADIFSTLLAVFLLYRAIKKISSPQSRIRPQKSKIPSKNQLNFHILSMTFSLASVIL